jgi:hypothetical protein
MELHDVMIKAHTENALRGKRGESTLCVREGPDEEGAEFVEFGISTQTT